MSCLKTKLIVSGLLWAYFVSAPEVRSEDWASILSQARLMTTEAERDSAIRLGDQLRSQALAQYAGNDSSLSMALFWTGRFCFETFQYVKAESLLYRSLLLWEKRATGEDNTHAEILHWLGYAAQKSGHYWKAEEYHRSSLAIRQKIFGPSHAEVARSFASLSHDYLFQVAYSDAEREALRAKAILEALATPESPDLRYAYFLLGSNYAYSHLFRQAHQYLEQARHLYEAVEGSASPGTLLAMNIIAYVLWTEGKTSDAVALLEETVKRWGPSLHPGAAHTIRDLGELLRQLGKPQEAIPLLNEASRRWQIVLGKKHPYVGDVSLSLGEAYLEIGDLTRADSLLGYCLSLRKEYFGEDNAQVSACLEPYSMYYRMVGKPAKALEYSLRALGVRKKDLFIKSLVMNERSAWQASTEATRSRDLCLSAFKEVQSPTPSLISRVADVIFATKGLVTEVAMGRTGANDARTGDTSSLYLQRYNSLRMQLAAEYARGRREYSVPEFSRHIDSLSAAVDSLEAVLARTSAAINRDRAIRTIDSKTIAKSLPRHSLLVEYLYYQYQRDAHTSEGRYLATIVNDAGQKGIVDLGSAAEIDSVANTYRRHLLDIASSRERISSRTQSTYNRIARVLYDRLFSPVEPFARSCQAVIFAPDAALTLISFATLLDRGNRYLIEKYQVHNLSAGRDLIRMGQQGPSGRGLIALGNPDFDASVADRTTRHQEYVASNTAGSESSPTFAVRNVRSNCSNLSEIHLTPLQNTGAEVSSVAHIFSRNSHNESVSLFVGSQASEERFKRSAQGHRMIHLATHGYYLNADCILQQITAPENPLLQSGFFLAGANLHGQGSEEPGAEDGVVTALEVSALDFRGTDLVVLSACETALGEVKNGEGVFGLRRAFQLAGVRTVISALWQIPDAETVRFMKDLYAQNEDTYPQLMQKTMVQCINELRLRGRPTHPFTWGAFVATGDWRIHGSPIERLLPR